MHVVNLYLHAYLLACALVELRDSTGDCHMKPICYCTVLFA